MNDQSIIPATPIEGEPVVVCLYRAGKEIACADAADAKAAVIVAAKLILDQPDLRLGDEIKIVRV